MVLIWWSNLTLRSQADSLQKSFDVLWMSKLLVACIKKQWSCCWYSVQCRIKMTFFPKLYKHNSLLQLILYGYIRSIDITSVYMATDIHVRCSSLLLHKVLWCHPLPSLAFSTSELPVGPRQVASYVNVLKTEREGRKTTGVNHSLTLNCKKDTPIEKNKAL